MPSKKATSDKVKVKKPSKYDIVFPPIDMTFEEAIKKIALHANEKNKQKSKPDK